MAANSTTHTNWADEADDYFSTIPNQPCRSPLSFDPPQEPQENDGNLHYKIYRLPRTSFITIGNGPSYLFDLESSNDNFPFSKGTRIYQSSDDFIQAHKIHRDHLSKYEWNDMKFQLLKESIQLKCEQYPELKERLLDCQDKRILDISGHPFWGVAIQGPPNLLKTGHEGVGMNKAGQALMSVIKQYQRQDKLKGTNSCSRNKDKKVKIVNPYDLLNDCGDD